MYNKTTHFGDSCSFSLPQYARKSCFYPLFAFVVAIDMPANLLFLFSSVFEINMFLFFINLPLKYTQISSILSLACQSQHIRKCHSAMYHVLISTISSREANWTTRAGKLLFFFSKTGLYFESFQRTHIYFHFVLLFSASKISGLLFRGHFYGGASAEVNHIWIYFTQRIILSIGI